MCKNTNDQRRAKATIRKMVGEVARILAIYENIDGKPDLVGFFASYEDEANLFEVRSGGIVKVSNYIPNYTGMGKRRIASMFSPMGYAIPC